ncbi:hypothetical protein YQE_07756, partial [Dendroctonus ponderosae]
MTTDTSIVTFLVKSVRNLRTYGKLAVGILLLALGISSVIYTPSDFLFDLRLRMVPGTPPYTMWAEPPENLLAKVYIFNVTNSERFLNGSDYDLHLQEIGPIVYREKFGHSNIRFNENSTLTYTITRRLHYLPELNTIDINDTIIAPNLAMLVMTSYFSDSSYFTRTAIKVLLYKHESEPFVKMSIYDFLHNASSALLEDARLFNGKLVPSTNVGVLNQMYLKNSYNVTVAIGPKYGNKDFFTIQNVDGVNSLPGFNRCKPPFSRTSETTLFPQFLTKSDKINAWKAVLCKAVDGVYASDVSRYGLHGYRFEVPLNVFNRTEPKYEDCYKGDPPLPNGLADLSACYHGYPFAASFPHFMSADPIVSNRLKGLKPDIDKHLTYLNVEKLSGVPLGGRAIFQINLIFRDMSSFGSKLGRFTNMNLPFAYVGYEIEGLPVHVRVVLYIMTILVPNTQLFMSIAFFVFAFTLFYYYCKQWNKPGITNRTFPIDHKKCKEEESFIKI